MEHSVWDYKLVALSIVLAIIGSYIALDIAQCLKQATGKSRYGWMALGSLAMGLAIWSMHFIGMTAFKMPMPMSYDIELTVASLLAATVGSAIAFMILNSQSVTRFQYAIGGVAMGMAVSSMHYIGMSSMKMNMQITYEPLLFAISIIIAVVASTAALWLAFQPSKKTGSFDYFRIISAIVMGFAIAGMHYTGMAAAQYHHTGVDTERL